MTDGGFVRGISNIVPTPCMPSGALDVDSLGALIEFVIGTGVSGVTVLGLRTPGHVQVD
jgi:4-hydroxy-tetrahydrodipicolinate synthase